MFIGDGAKLVRDAFELAKEKAPAIIFIDELDAIGTKRFDSDKSGDREVQRTMLELLNQLDGFGSDDRIKVCSFPCHPLLQKLSHFTHSHSIYASSLAVLSNLQTRSRSSLLPIESTFSTRLSSVPVVSIERSSSRCQKKTLERTFSRSIRGR